MGSSSSRRPGTSVSSPPDLREPVAAELVLRPARPLELRAPPPFPTTRSAVEEPWAGLDAGLDRDPRLEILREVPKRIWWVAGNGDIVCRGSAQISVFGALDRRRYTVDLAAGQGRSPACYRHPPAIEAGAPADHGGLRRRRRTAVIGMGTVAVVVGLGLAAATGESPHTSATAGGAAQGDHAGAAAARDPTLDFVYPPADPGRLLPGPFGEPVVEPVPGEPVAGEPAAEPVPGKPVVEPVPEEPGPTDPDPAPAGVPTTPPRASTSPASVPTTTPEASGPPSAAEVLDLGREALVPAGKPDGDLPETLVGTGLGLWTGGTGTPVVLVLGTEHEAGAVLAVRGQEASRPLVLFYGDNRYHDHVLGDPHVLTRAEAVDLLAATRAPVVLLLGLTADTVTVVEAAVVGTR